MTALRMLALTLCVAILPPSAASAADTPATVSQIHRAHDLRRRVDTLAGHLRDVATRLRRIDAALTGAGSDTTRAELTSQRSLLVERQQRLLAERDAARAELAALPEAAAGSQASPTGPLGPLDPQGLRPLDVTGGPDQVSNPRAFNPAISVIPDFSFFRDNREGGSFELIEDADGFHGAEGHEHESLAPGFNLGETELAFTASVDPYFDAVALLSVSEDGIEAEEVYAQTRGLPGGLQVRGGKFLSGIGYINRQHPHQWDFVDQNLAYELLFGGHGLSDAGVQVTWLPPTPFYLQVGAEALQGTNEKFSNYIGPEEYPAATDGGEPRVLSYKAGPRLFTGFVKASPVLGFSHALQIGASFGRSRAHQEVHDHDEDGVPEGVFDGTGRFWGVDLVYKYDSPREYGAGDVTVQTEYFHRTRDMSIVGSEDSVLFENDGWYAQASYGIAPRWKVAARISLAGITNERVRAGVSTKYDTSSQYSAAATFSPTEFSRLRVQYNYGRLWVDTVREPFHQVVVQMQVSLGAHGAHRF
jgi:hypothetical protein